MTESEKLAKIKELTDNEQLTEALDIARTIPNLGIHTRSIQSAWVAYKNPEYYIRLNKKPAQIVIRGIGALRAIAKNL